MAKCYFFKRKEQNKPFNINKHSFKHAKTESEEVRIMIFKKCYLSAMRLYEELENNSDSMGYCKIGYNQLGNNLGYTGNYVRLNLMPMLVSFNMVELEKQHNKRVYFKLI